VHAYNMAAFKGWRPGSAETLPEYKGERRRKPARQAGTCPADRMQEAWKPARESASWSVGNRDAERGSGGRAYSGAAACRSLSGVRPAGRGAAAGRLPRTRRQPVPAPTRRG
jgi:hypothetical protein